MKSSADRETLAESTDELVGRDTELSTVLAAWAEGQRLIVISGVGGIGKSTLALAAAAAEAARAGGRRVVRVWLSDASDGEAFIEALGASLGLALPQIPLAARLVRIAAEVEDIRGGVLLLLDAFDRLIEEGATLLERLMAEAPSAVVLVTSRERLLDSGAFHLTLGPIPMDDEGVVSSAARLLLARSPVEIDEGEPESMAFVSRIVRAVDGIPLAIEFAASRLAVFPLSELADRLADDLSLLRFPGHAGARRHGTMMAVIEWSCSLMSSSMRRGLAQLSIFRGRFRLSDARAVLDPAGEPAEDVLQFLINASLVHVESKSANSKATMRLLSPVRAFAERLLEDSGTRDETRERYVQHYLACVDGGDYVTSWLADEVLESLARCRGELDAIRMSHPDPLVRLRATVRRVAAPDRFNTPERNVALLTSALDAADSLLDSGCVREHMAAVALLGVFALSIHDLATLGDSVRRLSALAEQGAEPRAHVHAIYLDGFLSYLADRDVVRSAAAFRRALQHATALDEHYLAAMSAVQVAWHLGPRDAESSALSELALMRARRSGSSFCETVAAVKYAELKNATSGGDARRSLLDRADEAARRCPLTIAGCYVALGRGLFHHEHGELGLAEQDFDRALGIARRLGESSTGGYANLFLGFLLHEQQKISDAAACYRKALTYFKGGELRLLTARCLAMIDVERSAVARAATPTERPGGAVGTILEWWADAFDGAERPPPEPDEVGMLRPLGAVLLRLVRASVARLEASPDALLISEAGFRPPYGDWISTERRPRLRRMLDVLVERRFMTSSTPLEAATFIELVWPEERMPQSSSSRNRMHVLLNSLRKLGMRDYIVHDSGSWHLDLGLTVIRVDLLPTSDG